MKAPSPLVRGQGNDRFRDADPRSAAKRGQTVPYDVNGAPAGGTSADADLLQGQDGTYYRARANHTGTQTAATISDFAEAAQDALGTALGGGTAISVNYNDPAGIITVSFTGGIADVTGLTAALAGKEPASAAGTLSQYWRGDKSWQALDKAAVGLGNVDNTSDATKNAAAATLTNKNLTSGTNTFPTLNQNTTGSAARLTTARNIAMSGDVTWSVSFDGSTAVTAAGTLATVNANVGSFGSATQVATFTVNAKGLTTAAGNVTVTPAASSITGGQALTKADDTNVTLTLGGSSAVALLAAASLTLGWTGTLAVARGGTGASTASGARTNLGLVIGTDVQAYDPELAAIAGLTSAADRLPYFTGAGTASLATFTSAGRALVDDADATAQRATLDLVIGTSGNAVPKLNGGATTWANGMTVGGNVSVSGRLQSVSATPGLEALNLVGVSGANLTFDIGGANISSWNCDTTRFRNSAGTLVVEITTGLVEITGEVKTQGLRGNIRTITATVSAGSTDHTILCNAASGAITVNLPAASGCSGRLYNIKKIDSSGNAVTIDPSGAETVDGAATLAIATQWASRTIQSDGTAWFVL